MREPGASSERALILAPTGRDAAVAAALMQGGRHSTPMSAPTSPALVERARTTAPGFAADHRGGAARPPTCARLRTGSSDQPAWSDLPVRPADPARRRAGAQSGRGAARGRCWATSPSSSGRSIRPRWSASSAPRSAAGAASTRPAPFSPTCTKAKSLLQTALQAGHLGAWEFDLPEFDARSLRHLQGVFRPQAGRAVYLPGPAGRDSSRRSRHGARRHASAASRPAATTASNTAPSGPTASQHWVEVRSRAVRAPDGSIKSLVGVSSDITARKLAEIERENLLAQLAAERTALAELTATLEQRVEQRTADLMKEVAAARKGAGAAAPGAEDGDHRPAHRRRRARLQQPADGRDRQPRSAAQAHARTIRACTG